MTPPLRSIWRTAALLAVLASPAIAAPTVDAPAATPTDAPSDAEADSGATVAPSPAAPDQVGAAATDQDAAMARSAGSAVLEVAPDTVRAVRTHSHQGMHAYWVAPHDAKRSRQGTGVIIADGAAWTQVAPLRTGTHGLDPVSMAIAVSMLEQSVEAGPLLPNAEHPDRFAPRFLRADTLSFHFNDPRSRDRLSEARVRFKPSGAVKVVNVELIEP